MTGYEPPPDLGERLEDMTADELLLLYKQVSAARKAWQTLESLVVTALYDRVGQGQHSTATGEHFQVHKSEGSWSYDSDALKRLVAARARDERKIDKETGEVLESEGEAVARVIFDVLGTNPNWTVGGLKRLGIDVDDYRERAGGNVRLSVQL